MNNPTYQERVHAIADKMRQKLIETGDAQRLPDDAFIPILAIEAVKHMADIARDAYINSLGYSCEESISACDAECMREYLKLKGLISDSKNITETGTLPTYVNAAGAGPDKQKTLPDSGQEAGEK